MSSLAVYIRGEATQDIEEAATWYEGQQPELGRRFLSEVRKTFRVISETPHQYPIVFRKARRTLIHKFPFAVFYKEVAPTELSSPPLETAVSAVIYRPHILPPLAQHPQNRRVREWQ